MRDRTDCEEDDKKHMLLSSITSKGIRMTGTGIYYIAKTLNCFSLQCLHFWN